METGNRLDIAGKESSASSVPASYKKIREVDTEQELAENRPRSLNMSKQQESCGDGAEERMLPKEDSKLVPSGKTDTSEVKFISGEKQNGDAKVDIGELKNTFVGMGKEELMRYANDPFWVRLRWVLFVGFWLIWVLMLAGAVAIIIAAPKCVPPAPRSWWEEGPLVEINEASVNSDSLIKLKEKKVSGIILSTNSVDGYDEPNKEIITEILKNGLHTIIELKPSGTTKWFQKSVQKDDDFMDYYIWADPKGHNASGIPEPPNNWMSPLGGSSWKYSDERGQFYLQQMKAPDLNFRNPSVIEEFSKIIKEWLKAGVQGVSLIGADRLLVDAALRNEERGASIPGIMHDSYEFYTHKYTRNQEDLAQLLAEWKKIILNATNNEGILTLAEDVNTLEPYRLNSTLQIELPRHSVIFNMHARLVNASQLNDGLSSALAVLNEEWGSWKHSPGGLSSDVLDILIMLLPGTPILSTDANATLSVDPALVRARSSSSVMFGDFKRYLLHNNTVFAYTRVKSGNPGYLVACNPSYQNVTVDFTTLDKVSDELTVEAISENFIHGEIKPKLKLKGNNVSLPSKSAIMLTYVPKDK